MLEIDQDCMCLMYRVLMQVCRHAWKMIVITHLSHAPVNSSGDMFLHKYNPLLISESYVVYVVNPTHHISTVRHCMSTSKFIGSMQCKNMNSSQTTDTAIHMCTVTYVVIIVFVLLVFKTKADTLALIRADSRASVTGSLLLPGIKWPSSLSPLTTQSYHIFKKIGDASITVNKRSK